MVCPSTMLHTWNWRSGKRYHSQPWMLNLQRRHARRALNFCDWEPARLDRELDRRAGRVANAKILADFGAANIARTRINRGIGEKQFGRMCLVLAICNTTGYPARALAS